MVLLDKGASDVRNIKVFISLTLSKIRYGLQLLGKVHVDEESAKNKELMDIQKSQNKLVKTLNGVTISDKISTKTLLEKSGMLSLNKVVVYVCFFFYLAPLQNSALVTS